jgi:CRISPR-associated protein Cas2
MNNDTLNAYRIMWVLVFFDLPADTKPEKAAHAKFRKNLQKDGFQMFQYSIYMRHSASRENAEVHTRRIKGFLPEKGTVSIMMITDKQFGDIEIYYGTKQAASPLGNPQLELF